MKIEIEVDDRISRWCDKSKGYWVGVLEQARNEHMRELARTQAEKLREALDHANKIIAKIEREDA